MRFLKSLLFYPLLWLRGLVLLVGKAMSGFFVLGFLLIGGFNLAGELEVSWWIVSFYGIAGVVVFTLVELYDQLLLSLNPTGYDLILIR